MRSDVEVGDAERVFLDELAALNMVTGQRNRFRLAEAGAAALASRFGARGLGGAWAEIRDIRLVAEALGLGQAPARIKSIARPDGLRAAILQNAYGLSGKRVPSTARLRMTLAVVALERAFGNKIKSGLDAGRGLSVKASRLLAGQLAARPRDFGTDARLIATLAAEAVGAAQSDAAALRLALLRRQFTQGQQDTRQAKAEAPVASVDPAPALEPLEPRSNRCRPAAASRPDLAGFASEVLRHAEGCSEGWPGNRKAYVARVWDAISVARPEWGLTEIEFKSMLAEAHRTGHVVLANADIRNKAALKDLQASAITYKNTVWHFVRVDT